jgi:hypothetical protein|tara:strand:- start:972 stop:1157 length:186 start_codon:yes stop_codon:yes gene_type:complete
MERSRPIKAVWIFASTSQLLSCYWRLVVIAELAFFYGVVHESRVRKRTELIEGKWIVIECP